MSASPLHPRVQALVAQKWADREGETPVEIAPGIFFLGKAEVNELPSGLRVAVAGGVWDASKWSESVGKEDGSVEVRRCDAGVER